MGDDILRRNIIPLLGVALITLCSFTQVALALGVSFSATHDDSTPNQWGNDYFRFPWAYTSGSQKEAWRCEFSIWKSGVRDWSLLNNILDNWDTLYVSFPPGLFFYWEDFIDLTPGDSFYNVYEENGPWVKVQYSGYSGTWTVRGRFSLFDENFWGLYIEDPESVRYAYMDITLGGKSSSIPEKTVMDFTSVPMDVNTTDIYLTAYQVSLNNLAFVKATENNENADIMLSHITPVSEGYTVLVEVVDANTHARFYQSTVLVEVNL